MSRPRVPDRGDHDRLLVVDWDHYAVGEELARGGMGRILEARDRRLGRPVAIKELRAGSEALRARFVREARITAKLQHPSIVGVLEAGEWPNGEPFIAMRLVEGTSLDKEIAARGSLDERLALLPNILAVADALAYAHAQRIIHRDLKPHNILLGSYGETVVIDWGLAKDLSEDRADDDSLPHASADGETVLGQVLGTPAYMPEEQARGKTVDERADVYAIGAILYHLLAGRPPYTGSSSGAVVKAVIDAPPHALDPTIGIPRDLVTIVETAMARDAGERYPTAKELAAELKTFLTGQLVASHRYTRGELVRRWIRRNRVAVSVAAVATVALGVVGTASIVRIVREQARTDEQRRSAVVARAEAEDLLSFMLVDLREKLEPLGKLELIDSVAQKAAGYYERRPASGDDAEERRRGLARVNIGDVLVPRGDLPAAIAQYRDAIAIHEQRVAGVRHDIGRRTDLADARLKLAAALQSQGKLDDAKAEIDTALALLGDPVPETPSGTLVALARAYERAAFLHDARGEIAKALVAYRAGLDVAEMLAREDPASAHAVLRLAANANIADDLRAQGDTDGAGTHYRKALEIAGATLALEPANARLARHVAVLHHKLGELAESAGDTTRALAEYRTELASLARLASHDPTNTGWKRDLWFSRLGIASALQTGNDLPGALAELGTALAIITELARQDPTNAEWQRNHAHTHERIGVIRRTQGDLAGALDSARAAFAITKQLVDADPKNIQDLRSLSIAHEKIAFIHRANGDLAGALGEFRASLAITERLASIDATDAQAKQDLAIARSSIGDVLLAQKDTAGAIAEYRRSLEIAEALLATAPDSVPFQTRVLGARSKLGEALFATNDTAGALAIFRAVLDLRRTAAQQRPKDLAAQRTLVMAHNNLGVLLAMTGDHAGAVRELRAGLAVIVPLAGADPTNAQLQDILATVHETLAEVLLAMKDLTAAGVELRAALPIRERLLAADPANAPAKAALESLKKQMRCCPD